MGARAKRRPFWLATSLSTLFVVAAGCAEIDSTDGRGPTTPGLRDAGKCGGSTLIVDGSLADTGSGKGGNIDPRCGTTGLCDPHGVPDDPYACSKFDAGAGPPSPSFDAGGTGGTSNGAPDASTDAGKKTDAGLPEASIGAADAGTPGDAGKTVTPIPDASLDGGTTPPAPPDVPEDPGTPRGEPFACQVLSDNNGKPLHQCIRSGTGTRGAPCTSVNDCQAGLACVGEVGAGQCLPYCCDPTGHPNDSERKDGGPSTFCGERTLLEPNGVASLRVPVWVPADSCFLSDPFPCTNCKCSKDQACTVVKTDGTTGCLTPGTGKVGDKCPCAAGYYCSPVTSQCVKFCQTAEDTCAPGKCQATAGFPDGWGLCVGLTPALQ
jgi:hypothetical protein